MGVFHTWNAGKFKFDDLFSYISNHFSVEVTDYVSWRTSLMDFTLSTGDNALFPLLHFVLDDLPTSTKGPELDDNNLKKILSRSGISCKNMQMLLPLYFGYLCAVEFIGPTPSEIPFLDIWKEAKGNIVSRSLQ